MTDIITGFYSVATTQKPEVALVDAFTSFAPSLKLLKWQKANRQAHHVYRSVVNLEGLEVYDFDAPLPRISATFTLGEEKLTPLGGLIEVGSDAAAQMGGANNFFKEQSLLISRNIGQKLERSMFERICATSAEKNRMFSLSTTSATGGNTLAVITPTDNECCGLYSPNVAYTRPDDEQFFELAKLVNGAPYPNKDGIVVFGAYVRCLIGFLMANPKLYAALSNVDTTAGTFATDFPVKISGLLDECLINDDTRILMSNSLRTAILNKFTVKDKQNLLVRVDDKFQMSIAGVPVIASSNIPSTVGV